MKNVTIKIENISGLSFGAAMVSPEEFEEYEEDGILEDTPFEIIDSIVCGPLFGTCQEVKLSLPDETLLIPVSEIPAFRTNKEIDNSELFNKEQAIFVKKKLKWSINEYYNTWRKGQAPSEEVLLEVEERGDGSMCTNLDIEGQFNKDNLFLILADTLPHKETVIEGMGYINPDGSISGGDWEYEVYSYWNPSVIYDSEEINL